MINNKDKILQDLEIPEELLIESEEDLTPQIVALMKAKFTPLVEADNEWVGKKNQQFETKHQEITKRNLVKSFGLTKEEVNGLDIEQIIQLGRTKDLNNVNKSVDTKTEELIKLNNKIQSLENETIPGLKENYQAELRRYHRNQVLKKSISEFKINADLDYAMDGLMPRLEKKYNIALDEFDNLVLLSKIDNSNIVKDNGLGLKSTKEILAEELNAVGILKKEIVPGSDKMSSITKTVETAQTLDPIKYPGMSKALEQVKKLSQRPS